MSGEKGLEKRGFGLLWGSEQEEGCMWWLFGVDGGVQVAG